MYTFANISSCILINDFFAGKIALRSSVLANEQNTKFGQPKKFRRSTKKATTSAEAVRSD